MSIFDLSLQENKEELRDKILECLSSDNILYQSFYFMGLYQDIPVNNNVSIKEITNFYLLNEGIPISINNLNKLSLYQLIELFINVEDNLDSLIEKYKKEQGWKIGDEKKIPLNKYLKNCINSFLKEFNIKKIKLKDERILLDLSESYLIENIQNKPLQKLIMKYIKLKDSDQSDENLNEKINILSGLKNHMDHIFKSKDESKWFQKFISINKNKLKQFWQALGSHKSSVNDKTDKTDESDKYNYIDIKNEFEALSIQEKHNKINDALDAIIYLIFINNF